MTANYLKSGKICWLTHTIFTSADNITVVSIASQFEGENTKAIAQYISIPQDG
jgi:hypothetical protein